MASTSFIDVLNKEFSSDDYFHPQSHGNGLPKNNFRNFMFATGIECSYPTIDNGKTRRDQLEECGHYKYWKEDLHLVKELGLNDCTMACLTIPCISRMINLTGVLPMK